MKKIFSVKNFPTAACMRWMCVVLSMIVDVIYFPTLIDTLIPHQEYVRNQNKFFHYMEKKAEIFTLTGILSLTLTKINIRETGRFYSFKIFTKCLLGAWTWPWGRGDSREQGKVLLPWHIPEGGAGEKQAKDSKTVSETAVCCEGN